MAEPLSADQLGELRRLHEAATPGPWGWRGNDDGLVELRGHGPFGAYDGRVISALRGEPCTATRSDGEVALTAEACDSCKAKWAEMLLEQGSVDVWVDYRCPKPENLATIWLKGEHVIEPANRWAVRERSYRSDVARVDHPDAELIAATRNALAGLLDEIDALRAVARRAVDGWTYDADEAEWYRIVDINGLPTMVVEEAAPAERAALERVAVQIVASGPPATGEIACYEAGPCPA